MILLTGAGGFLGKSLLRGFKGEAISVFRGEPLREGNSVWMDLAEASHLSLLQGEKIDAIVHLASRIEISLRPNPQNPEAAPLPGEADIAGLYRDNLLSTANLIDFALRKGIRKFLFASSQTVYGMPAQTVLKEDSPYDPLEHYAQSKVCAELALQQACKQGLNACVLRFPGLFSEERHAGVVYKMCVAAKRDREIVASCSFPLPIDVLHVDDAAAALDKALEKSWSGWNVLNVGSGERCSLNLLADSVAAASGKNPKVTHCEVPQPVILMNSDAARERLGWRPTPRETRLKGILSNV